MTRITLLPLAALVVSSLTLSAWPSAVEAADLRDAGFDIGNTNSCVTPVFLKGGLGEATNLTLDLRENHGIFCSIVVYPVVPKDVIMLRLIPTAVHTLEDVNYTIETFKKVKDRLAAGEYQHEGIVNWA